jgi:hypothetical protein
MKCEITQLENGAAFMIKAELGDTPEQIQILRDFKRSQAKTSKNPESSMDEITFFKSIAWPE